jgi:hypothetical protein
MAKALQRPGQPVSATIPDKPPPGEKRRPLQTAEVLQRDVCVIATVAEQSARAVAAVKVSTSGRGVVRHPRGGSIHDAISQGAGLETQVQAIQDRVVEVEDGIEFQLRQHVAPPRAVALHDGAHFD